MKQKLYWKDILRVREEIYWMMDLYGIHTQLSTKSPNPLDSQIIENGGIGIAFNGNTPSKLYTPLGSLSITYGEISTNNEKDFLVLQQLIREYGLEFVKYNDSTKKSSLYAITKLPWRTKPLEPFQLRENADFIDVNTANILYQQYVIDTV